MRFIVAGSTAIMVLCALVLWDDLETALPIIVMLVWGIVLVAGLLLVRMRARRRRGRRTASPRRPRLARRIAWRRTTKPLALPRR